VANHGTRSAGTQRPSELELPLFEGSSKAGGGTGSWKHWRHFSSKGEVRKARIDM
jgi:hypothetical protein